MFERMIVATDLSPASDAVVRCLGGLRAFGTEHALLLQCLSFGDAASAAYAYDTQPHDQLLAAQQAVLEEQRFSVETRTVVGPPRREIVQTAVDEGYGFIVVGSQGRSLAAERLLGGIAYGVASSASVPVLVMPVQRRPGEENVCDVGRCEFAERVLFATDFSEASDRASAVLEGLVARGVRAVTMVHVQDRVKLRHLEHRLAEFDEIDRGRLEGLRDRLLVSGRPEIDIEIRYGVPHVEIADLTREHAVQLVVMGTQGRGFVGDLVLGSVSHNVVRRSVAPVLLVPPVP